MTQAQADNATGTKNNAEAAADGAAGGAAAQAGAGTTGAGPSTAELESRLAAMERERDDLKYRFARQAMDFDGYMRRTKSEVEQARQLATADVLKSMLEVMDDLDRAVAAAEKAGEGGGTLAAGVRAVQGKFLSELRKQGIEPVESVGKPFDPSVQLAVATEATDRVEDGTVLEEFSRGYRLGGRTLRPAMVKVSKAAETSGKPAGAAAS
jgi:molecular chaperone GrpE